MSALSQGDLPLQRFYRWEREKAGRVFLTQPFDGGKIREWTWAQAGSEVRRVASYLKAQNWEPGSRIGILSKNCAWWFMADLAIWMAGHVSVPVYPSLRAESVRQILEHSECKACFIGITDERETATNGVPAAVHRIWFPNAPGNCRPSWDDVVAGNPALAGTPVRPFDELATIIYTSGTTGTPKGVMHRFSAFYHQANALVSAIDLTRDHRALSYLPLAHIVERYGLENSAITFGWHVFFAESLDTFLTDLKRAKPTIFLSVPRLLMKFQQGVFEKMPKQKLDRLLRIPVVSSVVKKRVLGKLGLATVRHAASGAAPLPPSLLEWYRGLGLDLIEGYGMTEALITHLPRRPGAVRPGYVGAALAGVEAVRTENGELLLRSPMNMLGYYKDPQGTRDTFTEDGFFRTGDLVEIDSDGQMKLIGRVKEQFKTSKGKYVAPAPIEGKLMAHPGIESCCLIGAGLPSPFAIVTLSEDERKRCADPQAQQEVEESLRVRLAEVNGQLDAHERLTFIAIVDGPWTISNGLLTPTLKIRRHALEGRYLALVDEWKKQSRTVIWETGFREAKSKAAP